MKTKTERITELEAELKRLRGLARTKRNPVMGFGGAIQTLREGKGIGLRKLAERSGLSPGFISGIEQNESANPEWRTILAISSGLGMTADELVKAAVEWHSKFWNESSADKTETSCIAEHPPVERANAKAV